MAENKTTPTDQSADTLLNALEDEQKKQDSYHLLKLMQEVTGEQPKVWGGNMIGFGSYHYTYESGREGDWFITGFSPRKANLTLYIMSGFSRYDELLSRLGKFKTGKSCLYIKKLEDIDEWVLKQLIQESVEYMRDTYSS